MANNFSILAKVKLDTQDVQRQLDNITGRSINLSANTDDFNLSISVANAVLNSFLDTTQDMIEQVYELDKSITEFKKVSDLRNSGLDEYVEQLGEAGKITAFARATCAENAEYGNRRCPVLGYPPGNLHTY